MLVRPMLSPADFEGSIALSVFGGSFSKEAAAAVASVSGAGLAELEHMAVVEDASHYPGQCLLYCSCFTLLFLGRF